MTMQEIAKWFNEGGVFMWVILAVMAVAVAVAIERIIYYSVVCRGNAVRLVAQLAKLINDGKAEEAKQAVCCRRSPVFVLLRTAVERHGAGMKFEDIQEGVDEAAIKELPRMTERLNYLALFANVATLLGLLGTISGLKTAFDSLVTIEAARKATALAAGISEAMNTTAFGLIVAVPCMILYTALTNYKDRLVKDMDEAVVRMLNFLSKRQG